MGVLNTTHFALCFILITLTLFLLPVVNDVFSKLCAFIGIVWLSESFSKISRKLFFYKKVQSKGKAVLITGCDSGFGHAFARRLDSLGYRVFAGCLKEKGQGAVDLISTCSSNLTVISMDVTSNASVNAAKDTISSTLGNDVLWAVVNNAGVPQGGEIDWVPMEDLEQTMQVNTLGTVRVTKAFLSLIRESRGRLINNTSAVGKFLCPGYTGYCMSKSAGIAFTTGLRIEMMKWGVKVISIQPFFYKTPLTNKDSAINLLEDVWKRADSSTREEYGDAYFKGVQKASRRFLNRMCSDQIHEVIDCFEDAVTSADPLSVYEPAYVPHKLGINILECLPLELSDLYKKFELDSGPLPVALNS